MLCEQPQVIFRCTVRIVYGITLFEHVRLKLIIFLAIVVLIPTICILDVVRT